jgi:hypothetical protein
MLGREGRSKRSDHRQPKHQGPGRRRAPTILRIAKNHWSTTSCCADSQGSQTHSKHSAQAFDVNRQLPILPHTLQEPVKKAQADGAIETIMTAA